MDEGEVCMIHADKQKTSDFIVLSPDATQEILCFGVKIGNEVYMSNWFDKGSTNFQTEIDQAAKQIFGVKAKGWHKTGAKIMEKDEDGFNEYIDEFKCAYCDNKTGRPKGSCPCRKYAAVVKRR